MGKKYKKIDIRKLVIIIVIVACVIGGIAATKITLPGAESSKTSASENQKDDATTSDKNADAGQGSSSASDGTENGTQSDGSSTGPNSSTSANNSSSTNKNSDSADKNSQGDTIGGTAGNTTANTSTSTGTSTQNGSGNKNDSSNTSASTKPAITCTVEIRCDSVSGNGVLTSHNHPELESYAASPQILSVTISVEKGSTAYDALAKACRDNNIPIESSYTPAYKSYYIEGINYLYEQMAGSNSGWTYQVNGKSPGVGASSYTLKSGDSIQWNYVTGE